MTEWVTAAVTVDVTELETVSGLLWELGVDGIEERVIDTDTVRLVAGCAPMVGDEIVQRLQGQWDVELTEVAATEGLDEWRAFAAPWRAGSRFIVVPAWQEAPDWANDEDIVLSIDPGHTFGSGSHETTRMCLAEIEELVMAGTKVADIGCGSGVLAIGAVRLGASSVTAIDIDELAVVATAENAGRNGLGNFVVASTKVLSELPADSFDLVVANIGAGTLIEMAPHLLLLLAPEGVLVVSGVLDVRAADVTGALVAEGLELRRILADGQWRTLRFEVPSN